MEEDLDLLDSRVVTKKYTGKRPVFLTVICILTFVGVGVSIIQNWVVLYSLNQVEEAYSSFGGLNDDLGDSYKWQKIYVLVNMFGALLCLAGAIIMLNLRKFGYFIYLGGQIIPLIIAFLAMSNNTFLLGGFAGFGFIWFIASMIFPVGFSIMYGLNYKYMR